MSERKKHSAEFKAKVSLEAIRGEKTLAQIAAQFGVHPNLVSNWKEEALKGLPGLFTDKRSGKQVDREAEKQLDEALKKLGQATVENEWLKKKYLSLYRRSA